MWVGAVELAFNLITIEWLYKGLEEFKFITSRTLLIKIFFIISVFALVKEPSDYKLYFVLCALSLGVNALVNCVYARNYVHLKFRSLPLNVFCGAIVILGVYSILTNMYTTFNITFLGFVSNDTEVGFYSTAQKVFVITLSIFTALTGVMLPRMSSLIGQNKIEEYKSLLGKTANLLFSFSFPLMLFIFFFAKDIINIISGTGYEGAVVPLKIMAPLLFVLGYEQILVIQGLMPLKKDRSILVNSVIGATVGLTLNFLIVPRLESTGTAIVWVLSEMSVLIIAQFYMQKYMGICFPYRKFLLNVLFVVPLSLLDWVISYLPFNSIVHILSAIAITSIYVLALHLCFLKNSVVNIMLNQLFDKLIIRK
jgi:O-antigen/teichoic acid export membrane protein